MCSYSNKKGVVMKRTGFMPFSQKLVKVTIAFILALAMVPAGAFTAIAQEPAGLDSGATSTLATTEGASIAERLSAIEGVTSVTEEKSAIDGFEKVYLLKIEQPISHSDATVGTFQQRVRVYYRGDSNINFVNTEGYMLQNAVSSSALWNHYDANIWDIEFRFFGESTPEGLDVDSTELWQYLTVEEAAEDFHAIVEKLSTVLSGKRAWTGTSKGGFTTTFQCYYNEQKGYNDADAYISWCAPLCDGTSDMRFVDGIANTAGDYQLGPETAAKYRKCLKEFQLLCIKYRDYLQEEYWKLAQSQGLKFREEYFGTDEEVAKAKLWDLAVSEFATYQWQYLQSMTWDLLDAMVYKGDQIPEDTLKQQIISIFGEVDAPMNFAYNNGFFPYEITAATQMGNCTEGLLYLQEAVVAKQKEDPTFPSLATTYETDPSNCDLFLTDAQKETFQYSSTVRDELIEWVKTTDSAHLILVTASMDPWSYVRIPDEASTSNPNIHVYNKDGAHNFKISEMTSEDQAEVWSLLDGWLEWTAPDPVEAFVTRLYENVLGREADAEGFAVQVQGVKTLGAAQIARNFYVSEEFEAKAATMTNEEIAKNVYWTMLNRSADTDGLAYWTGCLNNGMSVCALVAGFVESPEFVALCSSYGVDPGSADALRTSLEPRDRNAGVTSFVSRLYTVVLGRTAEVDGLNVQCEALMAGMPCYQIAINFFCGEEYANKGKADAEFVADCYKAMMSREGSVEECDAWVARIADESLSREDVVKGFCQSDEFEAICQSCGMTSGMR